MTTSLDELHHEVRKFLMEINPDASTSVVADTNLLESGLLDSLALVHFVVFIEKTLKINIPIGDFILDTIASTASIYDHYVL